MVDVVVNLTDLFDPLTVCTTPVFPETPPLSNTQPPCPFRLPSVLLSKLSLMREVKVSGAYDIFTSSTLIVLALPAMEVENLSSVLKPV
ncbi:hypothetical protein D3C84_787790 [compost metagenome]